MAESILNSHDSFCCPICLDLMKDPVAIPCGHSFCLDCIKRCWDYNTSEVYKCPQCKVQFSPRPALNKNTLLAELTENLRKRKFQVTAPAGSLAEPGEVSCDICSRSKYRAVKSCLVCLASYCETHIQSHYESQALRRHNLINASVDLQQRICSRHDKPLEIFCQTDQNLICHFCLMNEHFGHTTVLAAAERTEKQKQLVETQREFLHRIEQMENEIEELKQNMDLFKLSVKAAVDESETIFTDLIKSIKREQKKVNELFRAQETATLSLAEEVLLKLEQDILCLIRRHAELDQLSQTDDHVHFLQSFASVSVPLGSTDEPSHLICPTFCTEVLRKAVSEVKEELERFYKLELVKFSGDHSCFLAEPKTREDFMKYYKHLTLDPNTAQNQLILSEENKKVTVSFQTQNLPAHQERFDLMQQVLCEESLSGRCYWEVEQLYKLNSTIAVSYKGICRKGNDNALKFGCNDVSWSLSYSDSKYKFSHDNEVIEIPIETQSFTLGIYLDHWAGTLSFYSVSDTMTLLHKVQTTFTQPLYAGFQIYIYENFIQICDS